VADAAPAERMLGILNEAYVSASEKAEINPSLFFPHLPSDICRRNCLMTYESVVPTRYLVRCSDMVVIEREADIRVCFDHRAGVQKWPP
jgi:hypothetical protein